MYERVFKRIFDVIFSFFALLMFSPIMLIVAIAIKVDSEGDVVFKTERIGRNQKPFKFYKFRSMRTDAPRDLPPIKLNSDLYLTRVGKFIRKTSLDELPQLWCILKGDMSIIGYRPCGFNEPILMEERERLGVHKFLPGLTGLAQISGRDKLAAEPVAKAERDAEYCKNITFKGDCKIFFQTILKVFKGADVVEGETVVNVLSNTDDCVKENTINLDSEQVVGEIVALENDSDITVGNENCIDIDNQDLTEINELENAASTIIDYEEEFSRADTLESLKESIQNVENNKSNENIA